jgi:catechol 2,3-dioxygenase-like lactoylglutathione lyase family enzyme
MGAYHRDMDAPLLGIDHVALRSFDLPATERFYSGLLGLPVAERAAGNDWRLCGFRLPSGALLDFFETAGAERPGTPDTVEHVALAVATRADLEAWRKRLEAAGCPILEEQDHGAGRHSIYFADPNGHYLELTCRPAQ